MKVILTNEFTQLNETDCVIYNFSQNPIEIATTNVKNSGLILLSGQRQRINTEENLYARSIPVGESAQINIVNI